MDYDQICHWLGLPPACWPPNHYVLLGLEPGELDLARIEQKVHERLAQLRQYQLSHPEEATEAMNRLAQAFTCLTDAQAKRAYDASLLSPPPAAAPQGPALLPDSGTISTDEPDPLAWLFGPWNPSRQRGVQSSPAAATTVDWATAPPPPPRLSPAEAETPLPDTDANGAAQVGVSPGPAAPLVPPAEPVDPVVRLAQSSAAAQLGLGTRRALYKRIARTRQLLWAWEQAGKYVSQPTRPLTRSSEADELAHHLRTIHDLLRVFPPILGRAGQPGYFVVTLARQQMIVPTFRLLVPSQREELARDWRNGRNLLLAHRQFLRDELRGLRRKSAWGRVLRALGAVIYEQPGLVLLLLGFLAFLVAIWPDLASLLATLIRR